MSEPITKEWVREVIFAYGQNHDGAIEQIITSVIALQKENEELKERIVKLEKELQDWAESYASHEY